jgi:hypothetical protein
MRESHWYQDDRATYVPKPTFRAEGERKISDFLDRNSISYRYEAGLLVDSVCGKPRLWYPDFYLPEFKTYIEYYGMAGNRDYDPGITTKKSVYKRMGVDVISVYSWMFKENWQGYIMRELKRNHKRNYRNLMSKPYWSRYKRKFSPQNADN